MSLVKSPTMTEKKIAANRRNRRLSLGPTTAEGKGRIAAAQVRHGFYAKAQNTALRSLGEDPAQYQELLAALYEEFQPTGRLQEELVCRLARLFWLINRADRSQEGYALRRSRAIESGRENRLHARLMRLKMTAGSLQLLARSVARPHYVTIPRDSKLMTGLQAEPELAEMGDILVALFEQLEDPGAVDKYGRPTDSQLQQELVLERIKQIFGLAGSEPYRPPSQRVPSDSGEGDAGPEEAPEPPAPPPPTPTPDPYAHITSAQWELREPVRQLLENILTHQAELCEELHLACLKEAVSGPSPFERAAEVAATPAEALAMRRMQDANMREVRRIINLLLKLRRCKIEEADTLEPPEDAGVSHDVIENETTCASDRGVDEKAESLKSNDLADQTALGSDAGGEIKNDG